MWCLAICKMWCPAARMMFAHLYVRLPFWISGDLYHVFLFVCLLLLCLLNYIYDLGLPVLCPAICTWLYVYYDVMTPVWHVSNCLMSAYLFDIYLLVWYLWGFGCMYVVILIACFQFCLFSPSSSACRHQLYLLFNSTCRHPYFCTFCTVLPAIHHLCVCFSSACFHYLCMLNMQLCLSPIFLLYRSACIHPNCLLNRCVCHGHRYLQSAFLPV